MSKSKIPQTDSIRELAEFWDEHDLTDFEEELEVVTEPIFERESEVTIHLPPKEVATIEYLAKSQGVDSASLIRAWVLDRVQATP
ncbi:MAG: CopG family antitoxin [Pirellulales bacterium]